MASTNDFKDAVIYIINALPRFIGNECIRFFQEQMEKEKDIHGQDYAARGYETDLQQGKSILSGRGNLYDAIEIINISDNSVTVGVDDDVIAYASIHNEGGNIKVTAKMKKYFFAKSRYYDYDDRNEMSDDEMFYWNMALKKVGSEFKIPQRQFVGNSELLQQHLDKAVQEFINNELSKL